MEEDEDAETQNENEPRRERWPNLLGVDRVRAENGGPNHYKALLELAGESEENAQQIEKDLPRTFTGKESLLPGGEQWNGLRNILSAFAAHCPGIGYVQAMNFIGAFLLLAGLREEDAFWALVIIVNEIVPGYFDEGMESAKVDQRIFSAMFLEKLPAIGVHLQSLAAENIVGAIMSSQWLLTLFVNVLSHHVAMRLWDLLFEFRSRRVLFGACLALVEPREEDLLSTTEMGECIELLQSLGSQVSDAEAFASRVRHWVEQELTEEWLAECKRWQQELEKTHMAILFQGIQSEDLPKDGEAWESLERELAPIENASREGVLEGTKGDALREALVRTEQRVCECGKPLRSTSVKHVRRHVVWPLHIIANSSLPLDCESVRVAKDSFQHTCQKTIARGIKGLDWDQLTHGLFHCWENGLPETAISEAEVLLSSTGEALEAFSNLAIQLARAEEKRHMGLQHDPEEEPYHAVEDLRKKFQRYAEAERRGIMEDTQASAAYAEHYLPCLRRNKNALIEDVESRENLHYRAATEWGQKARPCLACTRREDDMEKAMSALQTYVASIEDTYTNETSESGSEAEEQNLSQESAAFQSIAKFEKGVHWESDRAEDVLSVIKVLENNVKQRRSRLNAERELCKHTKEWLDDRSTELRNLKGSIEKESNKMEGFFAKQCDEMWLQQTAEAIEMLKAADERAAALVCNWMRNAAWQILDARRFACFEYVRLIDTANDIITDVADQLMPQLREHEPNPTSSGSSFKESQSNPLAGAKAFLGRLSGRSKSSETSEGKSIPRGDPLARPTGEDQRSQSDHHRRQNSSRELSDLSGGVGKSSSGKLSAVEDEQSPHTYRVSSRAAEVQSDLQALERRCECLQRKKADLRKMMESIDAHMDEGGNGGYA